MIAKAGVKEYNDRVSLPQQVPDDRALLEQMMADMAGAPELYRPTNYWKVYENLFLPEIRKQGLHDFRRRRHSVLETFGATDLQLRGGVGARAQFKGAGRVARWLEKLAWDNALFPFRGLTDGRPEWVTSYFHAYTKKKFEAAGLNLAACPTSPCGNPEDFVVIEGGGWSTTHLNYCSMVADAARHLALRDGLVFCELGTGMGRNIEIFAKLFPAATILLFDIPLQLYVSHQYLTTVFGDRVIPYRKAVALSPDLDAVRGKIVMLPAWEMPKWRNVKIDLFWNSASFQEMEPDVVKNYLGLVSSMAPRHIYIHAQPGGNYWGEWKPGQGGTRQPVLARYYKEALADGYDLAAEYDTDLFLRINDHRSYVFKSKRG